MGALVTLRTTFTPLCRVTIGGSYSAGSDTDPRPGAESYQSLDYDPTDSITVRAISCETTIAMSVGSPQPATARVTLAETATLLDPTPGQRYPLILELGGRADDGSELFETVFTGWTATNSKAYWPFTQTVAGVGWLHLASFGLKEYLLFSGDAEWEVIRHLLDRAGILGWDVDGLADTVGYEHDILVGEQTPPVDLIGQLDRLSLYLTHDGPDGIVKRRRIPLDPDNLGTSRSAIFSETPIEGALVIHSISRELDPTLTRNRVKVLGWLPSQSTGLERAEHTREQVSDYVPDPPRHIVESITSDLIEFNIRAEDTATQWMRYRNKLVDKVTLTTPGNPYLLTGALVEVYSPALSDGGTNPYVVWSVAHRFGAQGWTTTLQLEAVGNPDIGDHKNVHPVSSFTFDVTGPDGDGFMTVTCDGSDSSDVNGDPQNLSYDWFNDQNGDTLSGGGLSPNRWERPVWTTYVTLFDAVQWAAHPTISLKVTNPDHLYTTSSQAVNP